MSRRYLALIAVVLMVVAVSFPAFAHSVTYTYRETESAECNFDEVLTSRIKAVGHHKHEIPGYGTQIAHAPWQWTISDAPWAPLTEGAVKLYNQAGGSYNYTSSYAWCN